MDLFLKEGIVGNPFIITIFDLDAFSKAKPRIWLQKGGKFPEIFFYIFSIEKKSLVSMISWLLENPSKGRFLE